MPRTLLSDDGAVRVYEVTDDGGTVIGRDYEAIQTPAMLNEATIRDRATTALTVNRDFLAIASPSNAQTLAQVKALTRQNTAVIRLLLGLLDDTD